LRFDSENIFKRALPIVRLKKNALSVSYFINTYFMSISFLFSEVILVVRRRRC